MMIIRGKLVLSCLLMLGCASVVHRVPQQEVSFPVRAGDSSVTTPKRGASASAFSVDVPITGKFDTVWTIESGTYSGVRVPLDLHAALGNPKRDHFWRLANNASVMEGLVGWKSTRYPIPVAFRRSRRAEEITRSDSIAFW